MKRTGLHQLAVFAALLALLSVATGAVVTNASKPGAAAMLPPAVHRTTGELALVLLLAVAAGVFASPAMRQVRGAVIGAVALGAAAGFSYSVPVLHALSAQLFFGAMACIVVMTSESWERPADKADVSAWPVLAKLANAAPVLVVLQISMGAAYRHKAMGVLPHMGGAMVVALAMLGLSVFLLQNFPHHNSLRTAAVTALAVTLTQISLGVAVFVMGLLEFDVTTVGLISAIAHVSTGALTLGAGCLLALQFRRCTAA